MKTRIRNPFLLPTLTTALALILAGQVTAQTFTTLHSFTALASDTNSDGANPCAGLILSGNTLYGAADRGGSSGNGTVFKVNTDGTGFTNLHSFTARHAPYHTNSDGANPCAGLILSGNTLYGTALEGGSSGNGTIFKVNTNGTGFTTLYSFTALDIATDTTNSDGANPCAGLILSGNTLYGAADRGGSSGNGTILKVNTDGTGFTTLHSFTALASNTNSDGANPYAGLILSGNTLYGTAQYGGSSGNGTVFALSLVPSLGIAVTDNQVVLSWPTWARNYGLQTTTNLVSAAFWTTVSPGPVVVNGQNVVTNPISGTQHFYRLIQ